MPSPFIILYISNIFYGDGNNYDSEEEENYKKIKDYMKKVDKIKKEIVERNKRK